MIVVNSHVDCNATALLNQVFQMARDFANNFACGVYAVSVEKIKTRKSVPKQRDDLTFSKK